MARYDPGAPPPRRKPPAFDPYQHGRYRDPEPGGGTTYYPGGTGSGTPPVAQGPPPAAPLPGTPAPGAAPIDWAALISRDPSYIARLAELTRLRHDAIVGFGDASGVPGADASTSAEAQNNPYSVVSLLRQQLGQNQRNLTNQANAHGVLFSGAANQNRSNEANLGVQRQFDATQKLLSMLGGYGDQQQAAYADAYTRLAQNPPVSPTDPAAAATGTPAATGLGPAAAGDPAAQLPPGFKPPAPPRPPTGGISAIRPPPPLSTKPSVKRPGVFKPPSVLPKRATSVLPTRYG